MELVRGVVAVTHETVAARDIAARIKDGAALVEFVLQDSSVSALTVVAAPHNRHVRTVLEILHQRGLRRGTDSAIVVVVAGSTATIGSEAILHFIGHTDMVHQGSHGIDLGTATGRAQGSGHIAPLIGSVAKIGTEGAIVIVGIAVTAVASGGMAMVFHNLRRGGSHTTSNNAVVVVAFLIGIVGAQIVIVGSLIPCGCN